LKAKLHRVLGLTGAARPQTTAEKQPWDEDDTQPAKQSKQDFAPKAPVAADEDEDMDFFKKLAEDA
jgi:hypothetical protein